MGNSCCDSKTVTGDFSVERSTPSIDSNHSFSNFYKPESDHTYSKLKYSWHGIPFKETIPHGKTYCWSIKNSHIKDSNFVVGIIKKG
jgi:hypothetical protein